VTHLAVIKRVKNISNIEFAPKTKKVRTTIVYNSRATNMVPWGSESDIPKYIKILFINNKYSGALPGLTI